MSALIRAYQRQLMLNPLRTAAIQSAFVFTTGDVIAQQMIEKRGWEGHDTQRSLRAMLYAFCVNGPVVSKWFSFLSNAVTIKHPVGAVGARLAIDQVVFAPTILAMYFTGISWLEGRSMNELYEKFDQSYATTLKNSYQFWPMLNLVNFSVIPAIYRPLFSSCGSIVWNTYLSYANQIALGKPHSLSLKGPEQFRSLV
ncbi:Protein required for ethanol metabolism [Apophysomyces ossiformis]|uniref:Protein required for ethanol metabolism n=1 Tax=Apophysomyces ossiformis TaxID=679940 RepID=A0A8H7BNZ6_9FUNG|nr:Protein required for ethanol metabolism [Apophysomyces ossiformis]